MIDRWNTFGTMLKAKVLTVLTETETGEWEKLNQQQIEGGQGWQINVQTGEYIHYNVVLCVRAVKLQS